MSVTNLLVEKLNGVFGSFVTGINAQNLTVDLWNGVIRHEQLKLKPEALAALKLPVTVLSGTVRRLEVRVPWSRLSTEPVVVEIDTVELLAATNYDLGHESLNALEERIRAAIEDKLQRTAEAEVARQESAVLQDTYLSRLGTRIVENMRIKLTNLHARFEDPGRGVGHPLAAGFVLQELSVQTVNADWDSAGGSYMDPSDDPTAARRKLLALTGLEIYWREVAEEELLVEKVVGGGVEIHDAFSQWDQTWFINALDDPGDEPREGAQDIDWKNRLDGDRFRGPRSGSDPNVRVAKRFRPLRCDGLERRLKRGQTRHDGRRLARRETGRGVGGRRCGQRRFDDLG